MSDAERQEIAFVDVETTGLDPSKCEIIQLAAVAVELPGWSEIDVIEVKVKFDVERAPPEVLAGNSYDPQAWLDEAVDSIVALRKASAFLRSHATTQKTSRAGKPYRTARLAAHNAPFDCAFIEAWFKKHGEFCPADTRDALDTLALARWSHLSKIDAPANNRLVTLAGYYGIGLDNAHDALSDVRATVELARILCREIER